MIEAILIVTIVYMAIALIRAWRLIKRLERMNASAIVKRAQSEEMYINHLDSHNCVYVGKEDEWPEVVG